jgi:hypothetical protein
MYGGLTLQMMSRVRAIGLACALVALTVLALAPAASARSAPRPARRAAALSSPLVHTADGGYNIPLTQQQQDAAQRKAATRAADFLDKTADATMTLGAAIMGYGLATGPGETVAAPVGLGIVAFGAGLKAGAALGKFLWGDPFRDRHYKLIAKPLPVNIPTLSGSGAPAVDLAATRYLVTSFKLVELGQAYQTSLNRAIGAHAAHSKRWTVTQLNTAAKYAKRAATMFLSLHGLRSQLAAAISAAGLSTVTVPATTAAQRQTALKTTIAKLPKAVFDLFKHKPLKGRTVYSLLSGPATTGVAAGTYSLTGAVQSTTLDQAEDKLAGHLRTFALIVKALKPGHLPAGL